MDPLLAMFLVPPVEVWMRLAAVPSPALWSLMARFEPLLFDVLVPEVALRSG
jgi:hypothetical protein